MTDGVVYRIRLQALGQVGVHSKIVRHAVILRDAFHQIAVALVTAVAVLHLGGCGHQRCLYPACHGLDRRESLESKLGEETAHVLAVHLVGLTAVVDAPIVTVHPLTVIRLVKATARGGRRGNVAGIHHRLGEAGGNLPLKQVEVGLADAVIRHVTPSTPAHHGLLNLVVAA